MIALGRALSVGWDVTILLMSEDRTGLLPRAARHGIRIKLAQDYHELRRWLTSSGVHLLHVHAGIGWEGHALAAAGAAAKIPVIRTEHLPYLLTDTEQKEQYRQQTLNLAHHIAVSEASADTFRHIIDPARLTIVRNGIFPLEPKGISSRLRQELCVEGRTVLLTVARFTAQKDHATLLRALSRLIQTHSSLMLLLVGTGIERPKIEALTDELGLSDHVRFLGHRSDVAELMQVADLFVLPSLFEGLPLAVLEAMSLGLPVAATRIGGTVEALGKVHPFFADPGAPDALADVLENALGDFKRLAEVGEAGRHRFQSNFTADRMAAETGALYERLVNEQVTNSHRGKPMQKTRIAFIGAGGIAQRHLDILAQFEEVELVGFADPDLGRADQAAARFGATSFQHHQDMLETVKPDAVYVCIPPFAHGEPERDLIERNIAFFVEKPVSLDLQTAQDICTAVKARGIITAVGYHWRYLDIVDEARSLLESNPAQLISGYWLDSTPPPEWWWKEEKSGGQIVEQATHLLDLARFLVGEVTEVYGRIAHKDRPEFPGLNVPTATTASLTFESGVIANFASTCLLGWNHRIGLHIFSDRLAIELTDREIMVDVGQGRPVRGADGDPVWREDRDFIDAVRGEENRIRCSYDDALATHRLALAVVASAREGKPVCLELPRFPRALPLPLKIQPPRDKLNELPAGHRKVRSLGVKAPGRAYFFEYDEGPPDEGQVRLDTLFTGLSAGTELTFLKNTNPYFRSRFDADRGVFIENEPDLRYPVPFMGYMEVARIAESRSPVLLHNTVVASTYGHKSGHTADPSRDLLLPVPTEVDPILGVMVAQMGPICANAILHADAEAFGTHVPALGAGINGRPVLVVGAGTVGLMTALFARSLGASNVMVSDPSEFRRGKAEELGFAAMPDHQAWQHVKARCHDGSMGRGVDFVFQTRAHAESLNTALKALRPQGTVIDLAFYQSGAGNLRLGEEFHHNGLNIRCAQINRVPRGLTPLWDRHRLARATIDLLKLEGKSIREHIITHVVPIDDAPLFLSDLIKNRPEFLQIVFQVNQ